MRTRKLECGPGAGGPGKYTGKDLRTAHAGMDVKDADLHALVEDLEASLDHRHIA